MKTIVALATAPLNCAIHIIRISGDDTFTIVQKITKEKIIKEGYKIQRATIIDNNNQVIDDVLLLKFIAPKSYNGEDIIEINCHGGLFIANKIIELLIQNKASYARPGEFTYRAVINGKIDMIQANSINNIVKATNFTSLKIAHNGLNGNLPKKIKAIREKIFNLIGNIEVNIDYPEYEDYENITINVLLKKIIPIKQKLEKLLIFSQLAIKIINGFDVSIIGSPNVGKSSLLNKILNEEKAIVSNIPGTTRDVVEGKINYKNITFNFIDTAGIRNHANSLEQIGIKKTYEQINKSDLILFVVDASKKTTIIEKNLFTKIKNKPYILIINKIDLGTNKSDFIGINYSCKTNNINIILDKIIKIIKIKNLAKTDMAFMQTSNEIGIIKKIIDTIDKIINAIHDKKPIDLIVEDLHEIHNDLNNLLGDGCELDFLQKLFKNFCVGK